MDAFLAMRKRQKEKGKAVAASENVPATGEVGAETAFSDSEDDEYQGNFLPLSLFSNLAFVRIYFVFSLLMLKPPFMMSSVDGN